MARRSIANWKALTDLRHAARDGRASLQTAALPHASSIGPPTALVAQINALYRAGASQAAQRVLDVTLPDAATDCDAFEALMLSLEIDGDLGIQRLDAHRQRWARHNERRLGTASALIDAGFAVIDLSLPVVTKNRDTLHGALDRIRSGLLLGVDSFARARMLMARLYADAVPALVEMEGAASGLAALDAAQALITGNPDIPADLQALIHVNRAFACSSSPQTLTRAAGERSRAFALAESNGLPRVLWKCFYLREFESLWRGDYRSALADAHELTLSVEASDSRPWRRIARSQLSNAHAASSNFVAAAAVVAEMATQHQLDSALHGCRLAYLQGRDADAIREADTLIALAGVPASVRANARLFSAGAATRMADTKRAQADIDEAVGMLELSSMPALFIAQRAYALAYRLIGGKRFRDAAFDIQSAFDRAHRVARSNPMRPDLTSRQREIAHMAAKGATNRTIAHALGISSRTVGNHLAVVFTAFGIRARWQLAGALASAAGVDE